MANFYATYPPSSGGSSSNASVGTNGATAPTSSTEVAGINPSGNLQPLQTDAAGALITTPATGSVSHVIVDSSALPAGAATSADQATGNASLASIDSKLTSPLAVTGPLTDTQLRASAVPVSVASVPLPTGAATSANQTNGTQKSQIVDAAGDVSDVVPLGTQVVTGDKGLVTNSVIHGLTTGGGGGYVDVKVNPSGAMVVDASGTTVTVAGTVTANAGTNLNTSALALETTQTAQNTLIGAVNETAPATDTASSGLNGRLQRIAQRITSLIALFPAALGQTTKANSLAVTMASDQNPISDLTATGSITTQNLVPAGTATANSAVLSGTLNGQGTSTVQVTGTYTGSLSLQGTVDGSTWVTCDGIVFTSIALSGATLPTNTISSASTGIWKINTSGFNQVRVTALGAVTGTATVSIRASSASASQLSTYANISSIAGNQVVAGAGVSTSGAQRVAIASGSTATTANVAASATSVTLLAQGLTRMGAAFYNDSSSVLYLKYGSTASTTSFTVLIPANGYYELPNPVYNGVIDGIWASATGSCRVTSWSP